MTLSQEDPRNKPVHGQPRSFTTIGAVVSREGITLAADRRWSMTGGNSGVPVLCGQAVKMQVYYRDSKGQPMIAVASCGALSVAERGISLAFDSYFPDYLRQQGIDPEHIVSNGVLNAVFTQFIEYLQASGRWNTIYRHPQEYNSLHLIVFRNSHLTKAYVCPALTTIVSLQSIRPLKEVSVKSRGLWYASGSGGLFLDAVLCSQDYERSLSQCAFKDVRKVMSKAFFAATFRDIYSNPGGVRNAKDLVDLRLKLMEPLPAQDQGQQIDVLQISTSGVNYTPLKL